MHIRETQAGTISSLHLVIHKYQASIRLAGHRLKAGGRQLFTWQPWAMQVPARELQAMNCHGVKAQPHKLQQEKSPDFTDKDTSHGKAAPVF